MPDPLDAALPIDADLGAATRSRNLLLRAGIRAFAMRGYHEASTRLIESDAGVQRNLISHYWGAKEAFWKACIDALLGATKRDFDTALAQAHNVTGVERLRFTIRAFVRTLARYPELHRIMVDEGKRSDGRLDWVVQQHTHGSYARIAALLEEARALGVAPDMDTHSFYYTLVGATSMFSMAPECRLLSRRDPTTEAEVARHADAIAYLLVRDPLPAAAAHKPATRRRKNA